MLKQLLSPTTLIRSPQLFLSLTNYVKTDMNAIQMMTSAALSGFGLKGFEAYTIPGKPATIGGISYIVVDEAEVKDFVKEKVK
jgi:anionic cell wall polymer biosynthesis LytR-Cps2A-Psr (LCP) family protein